MVHEIRNVKENIGREHFTQEEVNETWACLNEISDKIVWAGYSLENQVFGLCERNAPGILRYPIGEDTIDNSDILKIWKDLAARTQDLSDALDRHQEIRPNMLPRPLYNELRPWYYDTLKVWQCSPYAFKKLRYLISRFRAACASQDEPRASYWLQAYRVRLMFYIEEAGLEHGGLWVWGNMEEFMLAALPWHQVNAAIEFPDLAPRQLPNRYGHEQAVLDGTQRLRGSDDPGERHVEDVPGPPSMAETLKKYRMEHWESPTDFATGLPTIDKYYS
ncbi:hypothetical protein B0H63DRAFT_536210 [Podospora didyma]|uniref:Uncharacterized protein n=1 Tax=Podospora didyma TaxID=330526 RepID=A0AAE0K123_9PEZI|nr:hypothetical protein B0H63DRAFT_536210 [Podospora didyma]